MYKLGINTGFAVNRYVEAEQWTGLLRRVGLKYAQFTADLLNVDLPDYIVQKEIDKINTACAKNDIKITSTFTGAYTRLNHLGHPSDDIREHWKSWFKKFAKLTRSLNCEILGSHLGILTFKDLHDSTNKIIRTTQIIDAWKEIADFSSSIGIKKIIWEPMSIAREFGETLESCEKIMYLLNSNSPIPFELCLDVDHGDITSANSNDYNPYSWIKKFCAVSPVIHLKQSSKDKSSHFPFIKKYNDLGIIEPLKILNLLKKNNIKDCDLILELSFRERNPVDSQIEDQILESVNFWRQYLN